MSRIIKMLSKKEHTWRFNTLFSYCLFVFISLYSFFRFRRVIHIGWIRSCLCTWVLKDCRLYFYEKWINPFPRSHRDKRIGDWVSSTYIFPIWPRRCLAYHSLSLHFNTIEFYIFCIKFLTFLNLSLSFFFSFHDYLTYYTTFLYFYLLKRFYFKARYPKDHWS